jgi:hypothetical protein
VYQDPAPISQRTLRRLLPQALPSAFEKALQLAQQHGAMLVRRDTALDAYSVYRTVLDELQPFCYAHAGGAHPLEMSMLAIGSFQAKEVFREIFPESKDLRWLFQLNAKSQQYLAQALLELDVDGRGALYGYAPKNKLWNSHYRGASSLARTVTAFWRMGFPVSYPWANDDVKRGIDLICGPIGYPELRLAVQVKTHTFLRTECYVLWKVPDAASLLSAEHKVCMQTWSGTEALNRRYEELHQSTPVVPAVVFAGFSPEDPWSIEEYEPLYQTVKASLEKHFRNVDWDYFRERLGIVFPECPPFMACMSGDDWETDALCNGK